MKTSTIRFVKSDGKREKLVALEPSEGQAGFDIFTPTLKASHKAASSNPTQQISDDKSKQLLVLGEQFQDTFQI